ncbi:MAG: hypothetical protein JXA21_05085 [Anaerolineae bacterium]|nr:hypothetical protein [Anaerolineae bacterium]
MFANEAFPPEIAVYDVACGQIQSLGAGVGKVASVERLGGDAVLTWTQDADRLMVYAPAEKPCEYAYTLKLSFAIG